MDPFLGLISTLAIGAVLGATAVTAGKISQALVGTAYSPLTLFTLVWLSRIYLYLLNFAQYDSIQPFTWFIIFSSMTTFAVGSVIPMLLYGSGGRGYFQIPDVAASIRKGIDARKLAKTIVLLFILGIAVTILYLHSIERSYGISTLLLTPYIIRADIAKGEVPPGFHYFYLMEVVGILAFVYLYLYRDKVRWVIVCFGLLAVASLILTTAKVNVMKPVIWSIFLVVYFNIHRLRIVRSSLLLFVGALFGFSLFTLLAGLMGESFENTVWYEHVGGAGFAGDLIYAYIYITGQIPTLDNLIHDRGVELELGKLNLLPISKLAGLLDPDFSVPTHIGDFYFVPFPFNTATYLDVMYKDFGLLGTIVIPFLLGWMSSDLYVRLLAVPSSLWLLYLNSVVAMWIHGSPAAAGYIKPVYWFQIGLGYIVARFVTKPSGQKGPAERISWRQGGVVDSRLTGRARHQRGYSGL